MNLAWGSELNWNLYMNFMNYVTTFQVVKTANYTISKENEMFCDQEQVGVHAVTTFGVSSMSSVTVPSPTPPQVTAFSCTSVEYEVSFSSTFMLQLSSSVLLQCWGRIRIRCRIYQNRVESFCSETSSVAGWGGNANAPSCVLQKLHVDFCGI